MHTGAVSGEHNWIQFGKDCKDYKDLKCTLVWFPTYITGSSLAKIVRLQESQMHTGVVSDIHNWIQFGKDCKDYKDLKLK